MLIKNPFFMLGVTPDDNKSTIAEACEELVAVGTLEESSLLAAQSSLFISKSRLEAELGWFLDLTPDKVRKIVALMKLYESSGFQDIEAPKRLVTLSKELHGLSEANLLSSICNHFTGDSDSIRRLIKAQANIDAMDVIDTVNTTRKKAGFPEITSELVDSGLAELKRTYARSALAQLIANEHPGITLAALVSEFQNGKPEEKLFIELVVELYEGWVIPRLRDFEDKIDEMIAKVRVANSDGNGVVQDIISSLRTWDEFAQPIQLIFQWKGLDEPRSKKIFRKLRDLVLWLVSEKRQFETALLMSTAAHEIFIELPSVANQIESDVSELESLIKESTIDKDTAALIELIAGAMKDKRDLIYALDSGNFGPNRSGLGGALFNEFMASTERTKGAAHEHAPWELLRNLSLYVYNEVKYPRLAEYLIKRLLELNPPPTVRPRLLADLTTLERNRLNLELQDVISSKNLKRALEIATRLESIAPSAREKIEWQKLKDGIKKRRSDRRVAVLKNFGIGIVVIAVIVKCNSKDDSKSVRYNSESGSSQVAYATDGIEIPPALNSQGKILTQGELRWCMFQEKRIDMITNSFPKSKDETDTLRLQNIALATRDIFSMHDELNSDYNARCSGTRYRPSTKVSIEREMNQPTTLKTITTGASEILRSWNKEFQLKETNE